MAHPMRENGGAVTIEQIHELTGLIIAGVVGHGAMDDFLRKFRGEKADAEPDDGYSAIFAAAIKTCRFSWWNQERITPVNFPGESFEGGDYDLKYRRLPSKSEGYTAAEIDKVVLAWKEEDATILGSASAGDGLFFAKEVKEGRRDQPNGWITCPGSPSVVGGLLYLYKDVADRRANVRPRDFRWSDGVLVLLRKVPAKGGQAQP